MTRFCSVRMIGIKKQKKMRGELLFKIYKWSKMRKWLKGRLASLNLVIFHEISPNKFQAQDNQVNMNISGNFSII